MAKTKKIVEEWLSDTQETASWAKRATQKGLINESKMERTGFGDIEVNRAKAEREGKIDALKWILGKRVFDREGRI